MGIWKLYTKIVGPLLISLGLFGILTTFDWVDQLNLTLPEQALRLIPALCIIDGWFAVILIGVITFTRWFWLRFQRVIIMHFFSLLVGSLAIYQGYHWGNDSLHETVLLAIAISLIVLAALTILRQRTHSERQATLGKFISLLVIALLIILLSFYILPKWFDVVATSFPDPNLRAAIRETIGKPEGFTQLSDLEALSYLDARKQNIHDLKGLGKCINLKVLELEGNRVTNITSLSNLVNLTSVNLRFNQVGDITPLRSLVNLTNIDLFGNDIVDLTALNNLTNITELNLGANEISNISPLANLINIRILDLGQNVIENISPLSNLTRIEKLRIYDNQILDISPLLLNPGIGQGDTIELWGNPLTVYGYDMLLKERGVTIP